MCHLHWIDLVISRLGEIQCKEGSEMHSLVSKGKIQQCPSYRDRKRPVSSSEVGLVAYKTFLPQELGTTNGEMEVSLLLFYCCETIP